MNEGFDIIGIISTVGGVSSALLGIFALIGFIATQSKTLKSKIKNWFKDSFGIKDLADKIDLHMENEETKIKLSKEQDEKHTAMIKTQSNALLSLLKKELLYMATQCMEKGFVTLKELEVLNETYLAYRALDGNSFMCGLMKKVKELPIGNDLY